MADIEEILTFWFGEIRDEPSYFEEYGPRWFVQNADFDREVAFGRALFRVRSVYA